VSVFDIPGYSAKLVKLLCGFSSENLSQHPIFENSTVCTKIYVDAKNLLVSCLQLAKRSNWIRQIVSNDIYLVRSN